MAVKDKTLDSKILQSAQSEFLEKGFLEASLNDICQKAGVSTGAIYTRYKGKAELFEAVIKPAIEILSRLASETFEINQQRAETRRMEESWSASLEILRYWIDQLYQEKDRMRILLSKSEGTIFSNYLHEFTEENVSASYAFLKDLEAKHQCVLKVNHEAYHILLTSYWSAIFELIVHDFTREDALEFAEKIDCFFAWHTLIDF